MVVSETLYGAGMGTGVGPLGELSHTVRGGYSDCADEEHLDRVRSAYEPLPFANNPFYEEWGTLTRRDAPVTEPHRTCLGKLGHMGQASAHPAKRTVMWHIQTGKPGEAAGTLLQSLPDALKAKLTVVVRPASISVFEVLYPPGLSTCVLPE